ncbi:hypothetical protein D3C71_1785030 [compost metagenome]
MGQRHTGTGNHQRGEVPCHGGQHMAGDKQDKYPDQQFAPLNPAGQQHTHQRTGGDDPGINSDDQPHLLGLHREALGDITQQPDRNELGGIEDKGRNGKNDHAQPGS